MSMEELRERRSALGLTQPELADALGIHRVTISNWERGHHPIPKWLTLAMDQLRTLSFGKGHACDRSERGEDPLHVTVPAVHGKGSSHTA